MREPGLVNFRNPQRPRGIVGKGTDLADLHLPVKINGDLALLQAIGSLLVEWDAIDHDFVDSYEHGFEAWRDHVRAVDRTQVETAYYPETNSLVPLDSTGCCPCVPPLSRSTSARR